MMRKMFLWEFFVRSLFDGFCVLKVRERIRSFCGSIAVSFVCDFSFPLMKSCMGLL